MTTVRINDEEYIAEDDDAPRVTVELDGVTRCVNCSETITQYYPASGDGAPEWHSDEDDSALCYAADLEDVDDEDSHGPHVPDVSPSGWCNSASIDVDERDDSVTVSISVGDRRGAFSMTVRRIPADAESDIAGCLILDVPYAGMPMGHMPLRVLDAGTFVIGS